MRASTRIRLAVFPALFFTILSSTPGLAQDRGQIERSRELQQTPTIRSGSFFSFVENQEEQELFTPASPGDDDIGVQLLLKEQNDIKYWTFYAESAGFYTNNIALTNNPEVDGAMFSNQVGLVYSRPISGDFVVLGALRQQFIRYDRLTAFDFDSLMVDVGATYIARNFYDINAYVRYRYNHLMEPTLGDGFFDNNTITFGLQRYFLYSRAIWFYVGAEGVIGYSDPAANQRDEGAVYAAANVDLTRWLTLQTYYRAAYHEYNFINRQDFNQNVSILFSFKLTSWAFLNAQMLWGLNRSSRSVFDYDVFNLGGGLQVQLRF